MKRTINLEPMEHDVAAALLAQAIRQAHRRNPYPERGIMGSVILWCCGVLDALAEHRAALVYRHEVVELAAPAKRTPPPHLEEITRDKHVSTLSLRQHAFAAYAATIAHGHGSQAAFEAATYETLRRTGDWTEAAAAEHTRRFIVPAYAAAFPKASRG